MRDKSDDPLSPPPPTLADSLDALTDADIFARCFGPEKQTLPDAEHLDASHIAVITKDTIGKFEYHADIEGAYPIEAFALEILVQHTTIPVPRVHRVVQHDRGHIIVMDRIPGKQLSKLWPAMSGEEKDRIAETLAGYVRQLRSVQIPHLRVGVPGPLDREMRPRQYDQGPVLRWVGSPRGPFASYAELTEFFERRRKGLLNGASIPPMDDSYPLVLTHHDIRLHNLILDDKGTLWMVDWQGAGVYPEWWEALAMAVQALDGDELWAAIVPRVCGEYSERQWEWMKAMRRTFV
ncbi:kinase-like domain-containing protein [Roridomyces roridus]|uniref:Kinase-like domain-containing protein n=1 Tax=Roridomyces roridus TaxID=1738132 RepID=A0AAD7BZX4_9AGAR|nr:kinase-like domain-containing protein [Roridomyces roridus]